MERVCIDWKEKDATTTLNNALEKLIKNEIPSIDIKNIVSNEFINDYDVEEPTDFNGWQCDWWSHMYYNGIRVEVYGEAFYGNVSLSI